ncbi:MAG: TonB-dependent receptor, partial [Bacteroidales bacterium]|nr:TonB-dependent receptor [Bacteroidales bacterium]
MVLNKTINKQLIATALIVGASSIYNDMYADSISDTKPEASAAASDKIKETAILEGIVIDHATGEAVIGATVYDPTSQRGAITDIDGKFTLLSAVPTSLKISFMGYEPRTIFINKENSRKPLTVDLTEESAALDEVVVVGYGTQRRTQLTGSVSTIKAQALETNLTPTLDQALGGTVAGLNITASSGQPGAASSVRIRGGNSVNASNEPLYVIDGFIYFKDEASSKTGLSAIESSLSPLSTVNPADIERIEVLKDVSATAIYGSRGANGVIIVTTKKGNRDKATISYRYSAGIDKVSKKLDLMNASEFAFVNKKYFLNIEGYTDEEIAALGEGTNWQNAMLRTAFRQNHEFSISGGSDKGRYAFSANYTDQEGIIINSGFERYNFHLNVERELLKGLTFNSNITFGKSTQDGLTTSQSVAYNSSPFSAGITNSFVYGLMVPPTVPIYNADGSFNYHNPYEHDYFAIGDVASNPVSDLKNSVAQSINNYLLGNVSLRYVWKEFTLKGAVALNRENITQNYFSPSYTSLGLANKGIGGIGNKNNETWQQEYTLDWNHSFAASEISALAGYTRQSTKSNFNSTLVRHFTNESLKHYNLADGAEIDSPNSGLTESNLNSLIARVNYTLSGRYNATATLRGDRSSRFAKGNEWGWFPSLGLSWNVSEEAWLKDNKLISNAKLRASAGVVGNQEIGDYEYANSFSTGKYAGSSSYSTGNLANDDLRWETTASYNVGFDLGLFDQRLTLEADAYYKKTSDLLLIVPKGLGSVATQLENVGNVENKGVELTLNGEIIKRKDLLWTASGNIAFNHNEVTSIGKAAEITQGAQSQNIIRAGEALGSFYGLLYTGKDATGQATFADIDGNGKISSNDRVILGSIQPKFTYGFSTVFNWKGWDAYAGFQGSYGNKIYNSLRRVLQNPTASYNLLRS